MDDVGAVPHFVSDLGSGDRVGLDRNCAVDVDILPVVCVGFGVVAAAEEVLDDGTVGIEPGIAPGGVGA